MVFHNVDVTPAIADYVYSYLIVCILTTNDYDLLDLQIELWTFVHFNTKFIWYCELCLSKITTEQFLNLFREAPRCLVWDLAVILWFVFIIFYCKNVNVF